MLAGCALGCAPGTERMLLCKCCCPRMYGADIEQFVMTEKASLEEIRIELAKLKVAYEVLEKSHRRLVSKVIHDKSEAEHFVGQMVVDRTMLCPTWLKGR